MSITYAGRNAIYALTNAHEIKKDAFIGQQVDAYVNQAYSDLSRFHRAMTRKDSSFELPAKELAKKLIWEFLDELVRFERPQLINKKLAN